MVFKLAMEIRNQKVYNQNFGSKLGWRATYELKKTPEKLAVITSKLKNMCEPTTVVDIMSQDTKKGRMYSLRLFNEIFGEKYNVSMLKDNQNKDIVSASAKDFLTAIENLTKQTVEQKQNVIFNKISNDHSNSLPMINYLKTIINKAKDEGKVLNSNTEQKYFQRFV